MLCLYDDGVVVGVVVVVMCRHEESRMYKEEDGKFEMVDQRHA